MAHDDGRRCLCVSEHRPAPLELDLHHVLPRYLGGPDVPENRVFCCPNAHRNCHEILRLLIRGGRLTYGQVAAVQPQPVNRYAYALLARPPGLEEGGVRRCLEHVS